jgi:small subunit ribosomal protein S18
MNPTNSPTREETRQEGPGRQGGKRFAPPPPKHCPYCRDKTRVIDYKQADALRRYLTDRSKIKSRRRTGVCMRHQRRLSLAIKRARHLALLPYTTAQG